MKIKQIQLFVFAALLFFSFKSNGQELWKKLNKESYSFQKKEIRSFKNFPTKYLLYQLNLNKFENSVKTTFKSSSKTILLPNIDGGLEVFEMRESSNFEKALSDKFPGIKSYAAVGIENPTSFAKISIGTDGFHAVIFSPNGKTVYIDPYSRDNQEYIVYKTSDLKEETTSFKCKVEEIVKIQAFTSAKTPIVNDGNLRTYRLALVCSAEYAQFHLKNQNISAAANETDKKAAVLSAMNTSMARVNGVFEKDLAVKMLIVGGNDQLIFLDADTDNITEGDAEAMIDEVQNIADSQIGTANYDIGHVFSVGGDGLAGLGVVCIAGKKARGVTGRSVPIGDPYDIDFVAHEMGHQFGASHTQNNDCNRENSTAVEPGSASTIMGYAGICSPNVQSKSDAYFHAVSIAQMQGIIASSGSCAVLTSNRNTAPVADAGLNYSIPTATPFILKGTATDLDGTASLTYNWEQIDNEIGTMPPLATNAAGPMFRSLPSSISSDRYMPALATVISESSSSTWEVLPSIAREMNFSLLVRDNNKAGGATSRDDMTVTVEDAVAFTITSQNTPTTWKAGSTETITWNKGITAIAPINCQNVTIKLSEDGGLTFPIILATNKQNDGSENITVPNNITRQARIMVAAADNIFYNINPVNFEIKSAISSFILKNTSGDLSACNSENQIVSYVLDIDFVNGFSEEVTFTAQGQPTGADVNFSRSSLSADGKITMNISNLETKIPDDYTIKVTGNSATLKQTIEVGLKVVSAGFNETVLQAPENGEEGISLEGILSWYKDSNAETYNVQIALDSNFTEVVFFKNVTENTVKILPNLEQKTTYYWRVQQVNSCNESKFSSVFTFTTLSCNVCFSNGSNKFETGTTLVKFNTINNSSGKENNEQGYSDFTAIESDVEVNEAYELSVNVNTDGAFRVLTKVWIDWNQNCAFDLDEEYDLGYNQNVDDSATSESPFKIIVPKGATLGSTILRVSTRYIDLDNIIYPTSCELSFDGEVEDYSILVKQRSIYDPVFEAFNLFPNPTKGEFTLNLKLINKSKVLLQLFDLTGRVIDQKKYYNPSLNFSKKIFFKKVAAGLYLLKVTNGGKQTIRKLIIK